MNCRAAAMHRAERELSTHTHTISSLMPHWILHLTPWRTLSPQISTPDLQPQQEH
ncbi:hypothetical protein GDO81_005932 [Engystomops pustulosus]|uniref:Uncharacterized protein n=1 Tax=Engystomops pustulosus TaxID=76066 RepID=A0AAV7CT84_ENGPU|nr:hypothetical protein GDO81_005932 [Engystomops pustulosus]